MRDHGLLQSARRTALASFSSAAWGSRLQASTAQRVCVSTRFACAWRRWLHISCTACEASITSASVLHFHNAACLALLSVSHSSSPCDLFPAFPRSSAACGNCRMAGASQWGRPCSCSAICTACFCAVALATLACLLQMHGPYGPLLSVGCGGRFSRVPFPSLTHAQERSFSFPFFLSPGRNATLHLGAHAPGALQRKATKA